MGKATELIYFYAGVQYTVYENFQSPIFFDITERSSHSNFYRLTLPYQCPTYTINFINLNDGESDRINLFLRWGAIYGIRKFPISDFFRYHRAIFALQFLSIKVALSMPYLHN